MKKILIAYGTRTGSTKEVAEAIGKTMASCGLQADVKPFSQVGDLGGYSGCVVGAPVNGMQWLPEAPAFIGAHRDALSKIPVAYYLLSVVMSGGRASLRASMPKRFDQASAIVKPIDTACFGGKMEAAPPAILRLLFGLKKDCPRDGRKWEEIGAWAAKIAGRF
jgi:menaquinone-dependent protoporphyrinogen oxidase